ncbi:MAG: S8 family peptidase [Myxococcales bacterium]|nr:S8 family peptidase [Myxococcales bacterium]
MRDPSATRELIVVEPASGAVMSPEQLATTRSGSLWVGERADGAVLLDVADPSLPNIRKRINDFADDSKVRDRRKGGTARRAENAIAPIETLRLATLNDIAVLSVLNALGQTERPLWMQLACRGGTRAPEEERAKVIAMMNRSVPGAMQRSRLLDRYDTDDESFFFAPLTLAQLRELLARVDCVHSVDFAPPAVRNVHIVQGQHGQNFSAIECVRPAPNAPVVCVLDTGIADTHPLVAHAMLDAKSVVLGVDSAVDTDGHGTRMAGIALYEDLGRDIEIGIATANHWIQSVRILTSMDGESASEENQHLWPITTTQAIELAEKDEIPPRNRAYLLAVTAPSPSEVPRDERLRPTLWSHAVDALAYHAERSRLIIVAAGNVRDENCAAVAKDYPKSLLSEWLHQPAEAANALTVGALTNRTTLSAEQTARGDRVVATRRGSISPSSCTGLDDTRWPIKPDILMEGGNFTVNGGVVDRQHRELCALTTNHRHRLREPLWWLSETSEASARAARLAADIWNSDPSLWPESVRALIVHSASWTDAMWEQFPRLSDRLRACGYGRPDAAYAQSCARDRATVVVQDSMPNRVRSAVPKSTKRKQGSKPTSTRQIKLFRLPTPDITDAFDDPDVELRVTLSYFSQRNTYLRSVERGLNLSWDIQRPNETEAQFVRAVNRLHRDQAGDGQRRVEKRPDPFKWQIGVQQRRRGTVQSDRCACRWSDLAGGKLIAVMPTLGFWDRRKGDEDRSMRFSLVVTVQRPNAYALIAPRIEVATQVEIDL